MKRNLLTKTVALYNILNKDNKILTLIITLKLGWILCPLKISSNLHLEPILFGYVRLYKFFFKIKGFGFKWKYFFLKNTINSIVYFKLGFTHRIALWIKNSLCKLKKRRFIIKHRSYSYLRNNLNLLFFFYKTYLYNKKGIYLRGTKFKLKLSKKKSKF